MRSFFEKFAAIAAAADTAAGPIAFASASRASINAPRSGPITASAYASSKSPPGTPLSSSGRTRASGLTFRPVTRPLSRRNQA